MMPTTDRLEQAITGLGYDADGLIRVDGETDPNVGRESIWQELHSKAGVDAAYFRSGVPLVAFAEVADKSEVAGIHRRLWNLSRLPLLVVAAPSDVSAFSCYVRPTSASPYETSALLETANYEQDVQRTLADFSRFHVEAGRLAERYRQQFRQADRVESVLLENLKTLRSTLADTAEHRRALDALLGRAIFVRYLEDRSILTSEHLLELTQSSSLHAALSAGREATYQLFEALAQRFNGDIFTTDTAEYSQVSNDDLQFFAEFFQGTNLTTGQGVLWPYDFSIIPAELISSIYEQLLEETQSKDAAYYTPRRVVDLFLDEVLPWGASRDVRVLDPSCGSGIFLAEAFKRLASSARLAGAQPTYDELTTILTQSIFGFDKNPRAVAVAAFGLYLALLEEVDPPTIWRDVRLPSLVGTNLIAADFFDDHPLLDRQYDLIVGNPPWQSALSSAAASYLKTTRIEIPDQQIAWAFVLRSVGLLSTAGALALLLPAKTLLHNKSNQAQRARQRLMQSLDVDTLIDLSPMRRELFNSAKAPAAALIGFAKGVRQEEGVLHVVPRGSPLQAVVDGFVVSQDDLHLVPSDVAATSFDVWKTLLWGDLGDHHLISRLRSQNRTLGELVNERGWLYGRGVQVEGGDARDATPLLGKPIIPVQALGAFSVDWTLSSEFDRPTLHRTRDFGLYEGPLLLIRRGTSNGRLVAVLSLEDVVFNDSVIGVAGTEDEVHILQLACAYINSSVGQYYQFLTSSSWGVERSYVEEGEHLSLPFPLPPTKLRERILAACSDETLSPRYGPGSVLDQAVFEAYGLDDIEQARVYDLLAVGLDQFRNRAKSVAFKSPSADQLAAYRTSLVSTLGMVLDPQSISTPSVSTSDFYAVISVGIGVADGPEASASSEGDLVASLLRQAKVGPQDWPSPVTILQPSILVLSGHHAHFVKPLESRYWTATKAREDGLELLGSILEPQGPSIEHLLP